MSSDNINIDTDILISEVEKRTKSWVASEEAYKNPESLSKTWQEITANVIPEFQSMDEEEKKKCVDKVKMKWKKTRESFFTKSKKSKKKKSNKRKLDAVDFEKIPPTEDNKDNPSKDQTDDVRLNVGAKIDSFEGKSSVEVSTLEDKLINLLKDSREREEDEDRGFLISLLPSLKSFNEDQKLLFRSQVIQLVWSVKHGKHEKNINTLPNLTSSSFFNICESRAFNYSPPAEDHYYQQDIFTPPRAITPQCSPFTETSSTSSSVTL